MKKSNFLANLLIYAITHPKSGKHILVGKYQSWQDSKVRSVFDYASKQSEFNLILKSFFPDTNYSLNDLQNDTREIQSHVTDFSSRLDRSAYPSKEKPYPLDYSLDNTSGLFLYALCKIVKPDIVIETGVAYGLSSMYILQALNENNKGKLLSIDYIFSPWQTQEMIGTAIPEHLRDRWELVFGPSSEKLTKVLSDAGSVDIFFHDSLHTYKNMLYEFEKAWPYIKKGGFLISDDIGGNNAFHDFCSSRNIESFFLSQKQSSSLGIVRKS